MRGAGFLHAQQFQFADSLEVLPVLCAEGEFSIEEEFHLAGSQSDPRLSNPSCLSPLLEERIDIDVSSPGSGGAPRGLTVTRSSKIEDCHRNLFALYRGLSP